MLKAIILIFAIFVCLFLLYVLYENQALTTTQYEVFSKKIKEENDGTNFIVIADLHNNQFGKNNCKLIQKIDEIGPEFIIIAGDLFTAKEYNFDYAYQLLQQLASKYQIFYAYGNHEQKIREYESLLDETDWEVKHTSIQTKDIQTFAEYKKKVIELGIHFLDNEGVIYSSNKRRCIHIFGGTIGLDYFKRFHRPTMTCFYLNQCFGESTKSEYQILVAHNPMYFPQYAEWGADLVLSGHVHGGMVRLPFLGGVISPQMHIFPKYDAGLFQIPSDNGSSHMIVSRGLGIHTIKIRLFNRPELVHVILRHGEETNHKKKTR